MPERQVPPVPLGPPHDREGEQVEPCRGPEGPIGAILNPEWSSPKLQEAAIVPEVIEERPSVRGAVEREIQRANERDVELAEAGTAGGAGVGGSVN